MNLEKTKIESEQRQETKEVPLVQESPEKIKQQMFEQSEKEVGGFKDDGQKGLEALEERASSEDLAIDEVDRNELAKLDSEADAAKVELLEKLSPDKRVSAEIEETDSQENINETKDFSKRYSSFKRSELASQVWQMRRDRQQQKKQTEQQNLEIQEQRAKINEEMGETKEKIGRMEKAISNLEKSVQEQNGKIWYKFTNFFKKDKLDDEKILEIAQEKMSQAEEDLAEKSKLLDETREVILESSGLNDAKEELKNFYDEQSEIKNKFEEEREQRDLSKISREKGVTFIHGLPLDNFEMNNTSENNTLIDTREVDAQAKIQMILSLEPTLSTSTINGKAEFNKGMMYSFGLILKGGEVVSAYRGDAGTVTDNLYARRSKYDKGLEKSVIQEDISGKIEKAIEQPLPAGWQGSEDGAVGAGYNEIVVQNPKVSGLYIDLETTNKTIVVSQVKHISEQLGLPVIGLKEGKMFDLTNGGKEISLDDVLNSKKDLTPQEKINMAEESIETLFSGNKKIQAEARRKIEDLKKEAFFPEEAAEKPIEKSQEINFLDAKGVDLRGRLAAWAEKLLSEGEDDRDGDSIIEAAEEQLKGDIPAIAKDIFAGKTKEECLVLAEKFKEDKNKLDEFFNRKNYRIKY